MTTPLPQIQALLPSLVPEERRGRPGAARVAALAAADAHPANRAAYHLIAVYACLAAGEAREALRLLAEISEPDHAIMRRAHACRVWAQTLERNWYPGGIGAETPPNYLVGQANLDKVAGGDAETMLIESYVVDGPRMVFTFRTLVDAFRLRGTEAAAGSDAIANTAIQGLARFAQVAGDADAASPALWAETAKLDLLRRTGRLNEARQALTSIRSAHEELQDNEGLAATWLIEGDWLATPGSSPEALGLRLEDEMKPPFADQRDDAAAGEAYGRAGEMLAGLDAPRAQGALRLRLALLALRAGDFEGQRRHLDKAKAAFADAGDVAGEHLASVHAWLAALTRGEFVAMRVITPLEWGGLHGPVKAMAEWAESRGSPSYGAGLGRLLHRSGQQWAAEGEYERAELAIRLARGLVPLNGAVPPWTIPEALARLDDQRNLKTRSLVRRLQILDHLPPLCAPSQDGLAWLADTNFSTSLMPIQHGVTGIGPIAIRVIERGAARLESLLELAGLAQSSDSEASMQTVLSALATEVADPAAYLRELESSGSTVAERHMIQVAADGARNVLAVARPIASLLSARLAERQGWDPRAELWFRTAAEQGRNAPAGSQWIEVLALDAWGKRPEALAAFRAIVESRALPESLLAPLALRAGDFAGAHAMFAAMPMPGDATPGRVWRDLGDRAEAALEYGDAIAALDLASRGIDDFEGWITEMIRDADRLDACDDINAANLFQFAVRARLRHATVAESSGDSTEAAEHLNLAFAIADRHRALALPVDFAADAPWTPAMRRWQQASTEHTTAYQRLLAALTLGTESGEPLADNLAESERELATVEASFTAGEHAAVRQKRQARTFPATEAQSLLPQDACLLEYQLVGRVLVAFAITSTTVQPYEARLTRRVEGMISRLLRACADGTPAPTEENKLARTLLEPFAKVLKRSKRIIVVPSGALNAVPFHALPFGNNALGATRIVSYLPAALFLTRDALDRPLADGSSLVIGDPAFDPEAHPTLRRLAGAALEARVVEKLYTSDAVFNDDDATEADLRPALSGRALLHIAAHGRLSDIAPNTSSIVLADRDELTVSDLIGLKLDADLAVLSACDTGRGTTTLGGDLVGLTRGFLAAGVKRCVVSLWPVDDVAACVTMAAFHTRLNKGVAPAAALAGAQREMRGLSGEEIAQRYRTMGGTLELGQSSRRRGASGQPEQPTQLVAFPEIDLDDSSSSVEALNGWNTRIWAPFVLVGC